MKMKECFACLASCLLAGCVSTAPVADRGKWVTRSSRILGGSVSWCSPDCVTRTRFTTHVTNIPELYNPKRKTFDVIWWSGYDINSWGYPAFIISVDLVRYAQVYDSVPSLNVFGKDMVSLMSDDPCVMSKRVLGWYEWVVISADYNDSLNNARHVLYLKPLNRDCFLRVSGMYSNEARTDPVWMAERMSILSNVVESIRIDSVGR